MVKITVKNSLGFKNGETQADRRIRSSISLELRVSSDIDNFQSPHNKHSVIIPVRKLPVE